MKKKRITVALISAVSVLAITLSFLPSIAKYMTAQGKQSKLDSDHFYFSSDYLKSDEMPEYEIFGNSVTFELRNHVDSIRINGTDITYEATSTAGMLSTSAGTLAKKVRESANVTLTYNFTGDELKKEITVSVIGTGDYTRTLQAKFIFIKPTSNLKYEIKDSVGSNYAELYIYAADEGKTAILLWDIDEFLIDETNDYVFGKITNNPSPDKSTATTETIASGTVVKIVFFKKDTSADYTCGISESAGGTISLP